MTDLFAPVPIELTGGSNLTFGQAYTGSATLSGEAEFDISNAIPTLGGGPSFVVQGLLVEEHEAGYYHVARYVGQEKVAQDIKRMRRSVYELMRRMGTPV